MTTSYLISAHLPVPAEADAFTQAPEVKSVHWWHWLPNSWVLVDPQSRPAVYWRDVFHRHAPSATFLVFQVDQRAIWSGYGPKEGWPWMKQAFPGVT